MGVSGRDYMRDRSVLDGSTVGVDYQSTPWMTWTLTAIVGVAFFVFAGLWGPHAVPKGSDARWVFDTLLFHPHQVGDTGALWQPFTAMWFHDPVLIGHAIVNIILLLLLGVKLERSRGSTRLLVTFLAGNLAAFVGAWAAVLFARGEGWTLLGCSGGIFAIGAALARGGQGVYVSLAGRGPFSMRGLVAVFLLIAIIWHMGPGDLGRLWPVVPFVLGHAAAYGVGFLLMPSRERAQRAVRRQLDPGPRTPDPVTDVPDPDRERVDALLDKIAKEGMGALSDEERAFLSDASKRF